MVSEFSGSITRDETVTARGWNYTFHVAPASTLRNMPLALNAYTVPAFCWSATSMPGTNASLPRHELSGLQLTPRLPLLNSMLTLGEYNVFGFCGSIATPETKGPPLSVIPIFAARQLAPLS